MSETSHGMRLTDDEVRERVMEGWQEINGWVARLSQPWVPAIDSVVAADDAASTSEPKPTYLVWTSLTSATEHLLTASGHLLDHGPTVFSIRTLLRTAMLAGAQVVWMLAPEDRSTRVQRASQLAHDAHLNMLFWVNGLRDAYADLVDQAQLAEVRAKLTVLVDGDTSIRVQGTKVVEAAAKYVFRGASDGTTQCLAEWRVLSCVAHALPWELGTRPETERYRFGAGYVTETRPSWSNLQGALSMAMALTRVGWRLLDERGVAGE